VPPSRYETPRSSKAGARTVCLSHSRSSGVTPGRLRWPKVGQRLRRIGAQTRAGLTPVDDGPKAEIGPAAIRNRSPVPAASAGCEQAR
jgi:hypothetical protein